MFQDQEARKTEVIKIATRTKIGKYYVIRNRKGRIMKWSRIKKPAKKQTVKQIGKKYGIKSIWD